MGYMGDMELNKLKPVLFGLVAFLVFGCAEIEPKPFEPSAGHIKSDTKPAGQIPELVQKTPILPAPQPPVEQEKYTVVVNEVPAKELLFALARDAKINVDIDPRIDGNVTINAVDQTLPQILDRIGRQVDMRYEYQGDNLFVEPDLPFFRTYKIDYLNIARDTVNTNTVATSLATTSVGGSEGGGQGGGAFSGNNSTTDLTSTSLNRFWVAITNNIQAIIGEKVTASSGSEVPISDAVITSPETGTISVNATTKQHEQIQAFIDKVMNNVRRQVLIQITIVEVGLSDEYQAGIDWKSLELGAFAITSSTLGTGFGTLAAAAISGAKGLVVNYEDSDTEATLQLLEEFGNVKVLSSPQLMALNNQTAILKRIENKVFFTVEGSTATSVAGTTQSFDTTIHQLPIGIVMTITPHIAENDEIILLVRPTISRDTGVKKAIPVPAAGGGTATILDNFIPETVSQEMESIIRLNSGQVAILGGLMEDRSSVRDAGLPGTSKLGLLGNLFKTRNIEYSKTETVIFIRPLVIRNPSLDSDLNFYNTFLDQQSTVPGARGVASP